MNRSSYRRPMPLLCMALLLPCVTSHQGAADGSVGAGFWGTCRRVSAYQRSSQKQKQPLETTSPAASSPSALEHIQQQLTARPTSKTTRRIAVVYPPQAALDFLNPPRPKTAAAASQSKRTGRFFRILSPHSQSSRNNTPASLAAALPETPHIVTRVGTMAQQFEHVLVTASADGATTVPRIDLPRLLAACHAFEVAMVQVGQGLSAKDLRNNIRKTLDYYQAHAATVHDMRTVLQSEKDTGLHDYSGPHGKLHLLKDPSCAMGLLWIRRSLQFQSTLFTSLLSQDPSLSETELASRAARQAYAQTLQPYHGFALRNIYQMAVQTATPSRQEWLARLGGFALDPGHTELALFGPLEQQATRRDLQRLLDVWKPLIDHWVALYAELDLEDLRKV